MTGSVFSEISMGETRHIGEQPQGRNFLAAGLDPPDKIAENRLERQKRIMSLKDYLVRHYVKSLRAVPTKLEDTVGVIRNACTDIMAFESIMTNLSVGGSNGDCAEAVKNILKAVAQQQALIDVYMTLEERR